MSSVDGKAIPGASSQDRAWFCASCGSADVVTSQLAGGGASCNICGWKGAKEDLAVFHFTHDMGGPDEVLRYFFLDVRRLLSKQLAVELGQVLIKWGFLEDPATANIKTVQQHMARYMAGVARGIVEGVVRVRTELEKERHHGSSSRS